MKTLVLVLAMMFVLSVGAFAAPVTATVDLYADLNLVTLPNVPIDSNPDTIFAGSGIDPWYNITRWQNGGYQALDDSGAYGNMLLGDGFWCTASSGMQISYQAVADGVPDGTGAKTDMWISLPGYGAGTGGAFLIGNPFAHAVDVDKGTYAGDHIFFTDGTTLLTWGEACQDPYNWVGPTMSFWYGTGYDDIWFDNMNSGLYQMEVGRGYWLTTNKDNLAMIIPAD